jgi:hypothetical protein
MRTEDCDCEIRNTASGPEGKQNLEKQQIIAMRFVPYTFYLRP